MVLSRFRRPDASLDVQVRGEPFYPGGDIEVRVTLSSREGFHVREGRVELRCMETFYTVTTTYVSTGTPGGGTRTQTQRQAAPVVREARSFMTNRDVQPGLSYREDVRFDIPADAPPTVMGRSAGIAWTIEASLDIAQARDIHQEAQIDVLTPPGEYAGVGFPPAVAQSDYEGVNLELSVSPALAKVGDTIAGTLRARALQDVSFPEIRVELESSERAGDRRESTVEDRELLQKDVALSANEVREWRFTLRIPRRLEPTIAVSKTSVDWSVKGVLSRRMRSDWSVASPVQVYTA